MSDAPHHHIVTAKVENKAGVLVRVSGLFARRGFNIYSLAVAPTDDPRFSRITIVVDLDSTPLSQVMSQLDKLINIIEVVELSPTNAIERELLLTTVSAVPELRGQVIELAGVFSATIADVGPDALTLMLAGSPDRLDDFEVLLRPFGITELQRTGLVALPKLRHLS